MNPFASVIAKLTSDPPDWLPRVLEHYSPLIGATNPDDRKDDKLLLDAARVLENGLRTYSIAEDRFGLECPPDSRRLVCAAVCAEVWHLQRGEVQPFSATLQEACEEYWQCCGNDETGDAKGSIRTWERCLREVGKDEDFREDFLRLVYSTT